MTDDMDLEIPTYKLISGERLQYHIQEYVSLIGELTDDDIECTLKTGKNIIVIDKYHNIGAFKGSSRIAEIRGKVIGPNKIQFVEGFTLPSVSDPDLESLHEAINYANDIGVL